MPKPKFAYVTYIETTPDGISKGWPAIISSLKSLLENGKPLVVQMARRNAC